MYRKLFITLYAFCFLTMTIFSDETEIKAENLFYKIIEIKYEIKGFTKKSALAQAVHIDKNKLFSSKEEFDIYIENLKLEFRNLRTLESSSIEPEFLSNTENIIPVILKIKTKDTWNIIALPYPKFDSNSGMQLKLKIKDYNFLGFMQTLNADLAYEKDENEKSAFTMGTDFGIPFKTGPVILIWNIGAALSFKENLNPCFDFYTGIDAAYKYKFFTFHTGFIQGGKIYNVNENTLLNKKPESDYHFNEKFYISMPFELYKTQYTGALYWTPYFALGGNWKFGTISQNKYKGFNVELAHSLSMEKINWFNNFRQGFSFSAENNYSYNTNRKKTDILFAVNAKGFYSFIDRIGVYGMFNFFYKLSDIKTNAAGEKLRGILNKRISANTAFTLNMDFPIKIGLFKFEEITGINWTRFFGFELHFVPFLDIALTDDEKTNTYFNPKHGWYSGGFEFIIYPVKMRSIYGRISIGYDLSEIKKLGDFFDLKRTSARDGLSASEIFIGIGLHY